MKVFFACHENHYQVQSLIRMFLPNAKLEIIFVNSNKISEIIQKNRQENEDIIITHLVHKWPRYSGKCCVILEGRFYHRRFTTEKPMEISRELCKAMYEILSNHFKKELPWGIHTGVRPLKIISDCFKNDMKDFEIAMMLEEKYKISHSKTRLAMTAAVQQRSILAHQKNNYYSLFIFIPFCPTRCKYCSFVSSAIEQSADLAEEYIKNLITELEYTADSVEKTSLQLHTIYVGGGTPTAISPKLLQMLLVEVKRLFSPGKSIEYTVEAGRADTITEGKLHIMKDCGVNRISINPQTFNDNILRKIGRCHTGDEAVKAFFLARQMGFNNINMDFIAGLEDESYESFGYSILKALEMKPENITVHALTVKRSADLKRESWMKCDGMASGNKSDSVTDMIDFSQKVLMENGYMPYYLYRQKNTYDNLENVGFSLPNKECVYNIIIMEEAENIIACGAAASSKLILKKETNKNHIKRIYNYKYPFEYNRNFSQIIKRKQELFTFINNELY